MSTEEPVRRQYANRILAALPDEEIERLEPHLTRVSLTLRQVLYKPHGPIAYVYFPENAMVSLVATTAEGGSVEVGVVGREGLTGIPALLGVDATPNESMVQIPNGGYRMRADLARIEFKRGARFQDLVLRYIHANTIQVSQTAACNRLHSIEERLSRWLLMTRDRADSDDLTLTQEFLAMMLGCRRAGVTDAAITLQADGYISYTRGHIVILDRQGLEDAACECYRIVKAACDRVLSF